MLKFLPILFFGLITNQLYSQQKDTLYIEYGYYFHNGLIVSKDKFNQFLIKDTKSAPLFKSSQNYNLGGMIFGVLGGSLVGYWCGNKLAGGYPNNTLLGIGGGLVAVSLPFTFQARKKYKEAIQLFNEK